MRDQNSRKANLRRIDILLLESDYFTVVKVRDRLKSYDEDPGWYQQPAATVALKANEEEVCRGGIDVSKLAKKGKQRLRLVSLAVVGGKPMLDQNRIQTARANIEQEDIGSVYTEGIIAGMIGAGIIAIWFLIIDTLNGRPLYTPTLLGSALFRSNHNLAAWEVQTMAISIEMTLMYTWVHLLVFATVGGAASWLLHYAEMDANFGFAVLLLFVFFEFAFVSAAFLVAEPILGFLAWPGVLVGNMLAATGMAGYFFVHHRNLTIFP